MFIGFIRSDELMGSLWKPMSMLNVWHIPLLFYVSAMGVFFCHPETNLEGIAVGTEQANFTAFSLRNDCHRSVAFPYFSEILSSSIRLLCPSGAPVVPGKYFLLCTNTVTALLLPKENREGQVFESVIILHEQSNWAIIHIGLFCP